MGISTNSDTSVRQRGVGNWGNCWYRHPTLETNMNLRHFFCQARIMKICEKLSKQKDGWIYKINLLSKLRQSSFTSFLQVKEKSGPPLESACSMASNNGVGSNPRGGDPTQQSYSSQSATSFLSSSDHQAFNSQTTASFANSSIVTSSATATGSIFRSKIGHCNGTLLSPLGM